MAKSMYRMGFRALEEVAEELSIRRRLTAGELRKLANA